MYIGVIIYVSSLNIKEKESRFTYLQYKVEFHTNPNIYIPLVQ